MPIGSQRDGRESVKIIFSSRPAFGHVFTIAPLAESAREAGHDVIFASGKAFLPRLEGWGFDTRKVGEAIEWGFERAVAKWPELMQPETPEFGARMFVDALGPRSLEDMSALIEEVRPDLVVYEATDVGAAVAARVPTACHSLSVWGQVFRDALRGREHVLWNEVGMDPTLDVTVGDAFLDIWPSTMQSEGVAEGAEQHWLLRPLTWGDPSAEIPSWIDTAEGPLVFVSLGTMFQGKELLAKVLDAIAGVECDALVLAGADATPEELSTESDRLRVTGFVNQAEVLRHADLVIHHGGAGTMLGALSQGLPALVLPEGADRPYTAASLVDSGAGLSLEPRSATTEDIAHAVNELLSEIRYRERAVEIQKEIEAMPSPAEVVERLDSLVRR